MLIRWGSSTSSYAVATKSKGVELETSIDNFSAQSLYKQFAYPENTHYKSYFKNAELS